MSGPIFISSIFSSIRADATPYCMIVSTFSVIMWCSFFQSAWWIFDTILPSAWNSVSSVRRPWMCEMAAPAFAASTYCCAQAAMSSCGGQRLLCG